MGFVLQPTTLYGRVVRLAPLNNSHVSQLYSAGKDESIWRYMRYGSIKSEAQMSEWVSDLLAAQSRGTDLPFVVILQETEKVIGATRYLEIQPENRSLEIGGTWYAVAYQRTAVNTECKYLLLHHAFEMLGCVRVQFKTDLRNERSQKALERIGAVKEGVLRNHMILPDGFLRTSVYYSILENEWPEAKIHLEEKLFANRA
jgi:RimJ/RimL family protein N-acetyltransferase